MKLTNWKIIVETFKYFISWVTIFYFAYVYLCSSVYIYAYDTLLCADICGVMHFKVNSWCKVLCHFPPYLQNPGLSLEPWFCRFCWLYVIWSSYTRDPPPPSLPSWHWDCRQTIMPTWHFCGNCKFSILS